jgi:hypothetical protein
MIVPMPLILLPFFLLGGAAICLRLVQGWKLSDYRRYVRTQRFAPTGKAATVGYVLLVYAILLFVHFYRSSGGASGVEIVGGQYAYMSKSTVIRPISELEYKMFPTQVARIMSAWLAMMAAFCLSSLGNDGKLQHS